MPFKRWPVAAHICSRFNLISKNKNQQFQNYRKHVHFSPLSITTYIRLIHAREPPNNANKYRSLKNVWESWREKMFLKKIVTLLNLLKCLLLQRSGLAFNDSALSELDCSRFMVNHVTLTTPDERRLRNVINDLFPANFNHLERHWKSIKIKKRKNSLHKKKARRQKIGNERRRWLS